MVNEETNKSGFATASLVLSIIGICTSFIPIINNLSFFLAIIAIIFSIIALIKKASKGMAIAGIIIAVLAIIITINSQKALVDAIDTAVNDFNDSMEEMTGNRTQDILINNLDVNIGNFEIIDDDYFTDTKLPVTLKNKSNEMKSFDVQIEAIDKDGNRIDTDTIYANNLGSGQSQKFDVFTLVTSDKITEYKNATFKIVQVSMY